MSFRRVLLALVVLAVTGIVWVALLVGFLLAGVELLPQGIAVGVTVALVIPAFLAGVVTVSTTLPRRRGFFRQRDVSALFRVLPRWLRWPAQGLFIAFWLSAVTTSIGARGGAEAIHGARMALSVLGGFGVAGAALCLVAAASRRAA